MVNYSESSLNHTFAALADPTRRAIVSRLAGGGAAVSDLAMPFDMSLPAISKHLRVLQDAGLLRKTKQGRQQICSLDSRRLEHASEWLARYREYWEGQLDRFAAHVESEHKQEEERWQQQKRTRRSASAGLSKRRAQKSIQRGRRRSR
jgi:DNA-binding transcriptional ArsR family regulator